MISYSVFINFQLKRVPEIIFASDGIEPIDWDHVKMTEILKSKLDCL